MRAYRTLSALFLIGVVLTSAAQAAQLSQAQVEAVKSRYFTRIGIPSANLHSAKVGFPDGVKGFTTYKLDEAGWGSSKPYANFSDRGLHTRSCASDAVVLATNLSSTSYLSQAKDTLLTASDFAVIDVIKGDPQGLARVGNTVEVVRIGGEVTDQGEKLRVTVSKRPDYSPGHEYLLFLSGKTASTAMPFHADDFVTIEVLNHRVYPSRNAWGGFEPGDSYYDVADRIHYLSATFQCPSGLISNG
jgi:hypothetical protein